MLEEAKQKQKHLENQASEIANKQKLAQQLHTKSITEAKLGVQQSQAALAEQEQKNRLFKRVIREHRLDFGSKDDTTGTGRFKMGRRMKKAKKKSKKGKKKSKKGKKKAKNC